LIGSWKRPPHDTLIDFFVIFLLADSDLSISFAENDNSMGAIITDCSC
jgi:hypothetical protein